MTLRRSLAVTAVTALTSSAAFFAAPVAFAAETPSSPTPSASASAGQQAKANSPYKVTVIGAPTQAVAGGPAVEFSVNYANTTDQDIVFPPTLAIDAVVDPSNFALKANQVKLEFQAPGASWLPVRVQDDLRADFGRFNLDWNTAHKVKPGENWTLKFRLSFAADAPGRSLEVRLGASPVTAEQLPSGQPGDAFAKFALALKGSSTTSPSPTPQPGGSTGGALPDQPTAPGTAHQDPNPDKGNGPAISFSALPGDIVVGGKPVEVAVDIKNTTGKNVDFMPFVSLGNVATDTPLRASHIVLEAKAPGSAAWGKVQLSDAEVDESGVSSVGGWFGAQDPEDPHAFGVIKLAKDESVQIQLRLSFTADAPLGEAVAFLLGLGSSDENSSDYFSASDFYVFNLVAPGTKGPANPDVRPVPPVKLPAKPKPSQNLAETGGSDSSAVTYAIVGGVALVGGAGLLVVMKRRRSGATPA